MRGGAIAILLLSFLGLIAGKDAKGTKWVKCKTLGSDRCFETTLKEITVKIGNKGTNSDVAIEICSDYKNTDCCKTPPLKSKLSDDWSKGDTEVWKDRYFGPCKGKKFLVKQGLSLTLSKNKQDGLNVTSIVLDTKSPDKKVKEPERFACGGYFLGGSNLKQTHLCRTSPYKFMQIENMTVAMDADGTDDSVTAKVCSDVNDVCCEKKLSHLLSDDWKKNKVEVWRNDDFGDCGDILYKVQSKPIVSIQKTGKDDLTVKNVAFVMKSNDVPVETYEYKCEGFSLKGNCKDKSLCRHTFARCSIPNNLKTKSTPVSPINVPVSPIRTTPRTKTTTSRPPFRSG